MNQPERQVYYKVPAALYADLIAKLKSRKDFADRKYIPESEDCHFVRYSFIHNAEKVSVVFDTKAEMLTVTAFREAIDIIDAIYSELASKLEKKLQKTTKKKATEEASKDEASTKTSKTKKSSGIAQMLNTYATDKRFGDSSKEKRYISYNYQDILKSRTSTPVDSSTAVLLPPPQPTPALQKRARNSFEAAKLDARKPVTPAKNATDDSQSLVASKKPASEVASQKTASTGTQSKAQKKVAETQKAAAEKKSNQSIQKAQPNTSAKKTAEKKKAVEAVEVVAERKIDTPEYKDGYAVKMMDQDRVKHIIKELKARADIKVLDAGTVKSTTGSITTYLIEGTAKQKVYLRHLIRKNMLQLQGKSSALFTEIQVLITREQDLLDEKSQKEPKGAYKEVKKALPAAYDFLSEQSKIDFTIGLIDIYSDEVRLSDYSVLLVPPYRGLERLLFDLQIAKGIEVKMIGQAYEKEDGSYTLKSGYKKKIDSIVYNEVMAALYTEYFEKRNFYAHSNNTDQLSIRVISDKAQAKAIFENLLKLINYNCKKLKEIGLNID